MILVNYDTTNYYNEHVGEKYYCANEEIALKVINTELKKEGLQEIDELKGNIEVEDNDGDITYICVTDIEVIEE